MSVAPSRRIFQPVRGRGLRKLLWKRLRLPRSIVHPALTAAKVAANPAQVRVRRRLGRSLVRSSAAGTGGAESLRSQSIGRIPDDRGILLFGSGELPGTDAVVSTCARIYRESRESAGVDEHLFNPRKRFLLALLAGADFCRYPELIRFMVSRPVLDTATEYLGCVPLLSGAALWWTPENDSAERSQLYHFDGEDERQVKLLLNIFETGPEHGPFTALPADVSAPIRRSHSLRSRIPDALVEDVCGAQHALELVGPPGSGGFVDTCRCLHFGSRGTRSDRLVLMVQFMRFECPTESTFDFAVPPDLPGLAPDELQMLALGLR
jgi:hypothetical protein